LSSDIAIIDVRDDEREIGHVVGALHFPSEEWKNSDYVRKIALDNKDKDSIICYCFKSQHRGPTCAKALASYYETLQAEGNEGNQKFPIM